MWGEAQTLAGLLLTYDPQGCGAAFSSLMGYQYHQQRCGKPPCEVDSPSFPCNHCGKTYRSKAGHDYHMRSEHTAPVSGSPLSFRHRAWVPLHLLMCPCPQHMPGSPHLQAMLAPVIHLGLLTLQPPEEPQDKPPEAEDLLGVERTPSGRIRRTSAQVAVFHLQEIAEDELARDWTKRQMKDDLVPETARVSHLGSEQDVPPSGVPCDGPVTWASVDLEGSDLSMEGTVRASLEKWECYCQLWPNCQGSAQCLPVFTAQLHSARPPHTQPPAARDVEE